MKSGGNKRGNASSAGMSKTQKKKMRKIQKENEEFKSIELAKTMFAKCDSTYGSFTNKTAEQRFDELSPIFQRTALSKTQKQG